MPRAGGGRLGSYRGRCETALDKKGVDGEAKETVIRHDFGVQFEL